MLGEAELALLSGDFPFFSGSASLSFVCCFLVKGEAAAALGRVVEIYPFVYITISSIFFPLPSKQQAFRHLGQFLFPSLSLFFIFEEGEEALERQKVCLDKTQSLGNVQGLSDVM